MLTPRRITQLADLIEQLADVLPSFKRLLTSAAVLTNGAASSHARTEDVLKVLASGSKPRPGQVRSLQRAHSSTTVARASLEMAVAAAMSVEQVDDLDRNLRDVVDLLREEAATASTEAPLEAGRK